MLRFLPAVSAEAYGRMQSLTRATILSTVPVGAVSQKRMNGQRRNSRSFITTPSTTRGAAAAARFEHLQPTCGACTFPDDDKFLIHTMWVLTSTVDTSPRPPLHGRVIRTHGVHGDCTKE